MPIRAGLLLLSLVAALFFVALGNHDLQGSTEPRVAGIAMQMHLDNDWVTPRLNGEPFLEKPPLSLWLDVLAIRAFGMGTWVLRLASAVAGFFCVGVVFCLLQASGRPTRIAFTAAFMLATMASYWSNVRQVGEDSLLTLGVTLALLAYFRANRVREHSGRTFTAWWVMFSLGIALSTLSKGVLGLALPGGVIFTWLVVDSLRKKHIDRVDWLSPAVMTLVALIPLALWLYALYLREGPQALGDVLWANSVGRFNGSFQEAGHFEPFYYYFLKLGQSFLPWNLLVYLSLWHFRKQLRVDPYLLFFTIWLLAQFALLTLASSKRMVYLMSLAPAAAVLAAEYTAVLVDALRRRAMSGGWASTLYRARQVVGGAGALLLMSCYLIAALWFKSQADHNESFLPLAEQIRSLEEGGRNVMLYQPSERLAGAAVFYSRSTLDVLKSQAQLHSFLAASPRHIAVIELQQAPDAPLKVFRHFDVGDRIYYFVTY